MQYPHRESPLENLQMIQGKGMDVFLEHERQLWTARTAADRFRSMTGIARIAGKLWKKNTFVKKLIQLEQC